MRRFAAVNAMTDGDKNSSRLRPLGPIVGFGSRAAAVTLRPVVSLAGATARPLAGVAGATVRPLAGAAKVAIRPLEGTVAAAVDSGKQLERRTVLRVLDSSEVRRLPSAALDNPRTQAAIGSAMESDGAKQLVAQLFDSGLFDEIVDRLLQSDGLWRLIDEVAASPAVLAAVTQQGLGFADQVGDITRTRSRTADEWLERGASRLAWWRSRQQALDRPASHETATQALDGPASHETATQAPGGPASHETATDDLLSDSEPTTP